MDARCGCSTDAIARASRRSCVASPADRRGSVFSATDAVEREVVALVDDAHAAGADAAIDGELAGQVRRQQRVAQVAAASTALRRAARVDASAADALLRRRLIVGGRCLRSRVSPDPPSRRRSITSATDAATAVSSCRSSALKGSSLRLCPSVITPSSDPVGARSGTSSCAWVSSQPLTIARRQSRQRGGRIGLERDVQRRRRAGQQRRQRAVGRQRRQVLLRIAQHGAFRVLDAQPHVLQVQRAIDFRRHQRRQLRQVARVAAAGGQRQQDAARVVVLAEEAAVDRLEQHAAAPQHRGQRRQQQPQQRRAQRQDVAEPFVAPLVDRQASATAGIESAAITV